MTASAVDELLAGLPSAQQDRLAAQPDRALALAELWRTARAAHPTIELSAALFVPYLDARLPPAPWPPARLAELPAGDLYLACGCIHGDMVALRAVEALCQLEVQWALKRLSAVSSKAEEVLHLVQVRLLTRQQASEPPKLAQYAGRSSLSAWVRVVATREALMLYRKERRHTGGNELGDVPPGLTTDPELAFFKSRYREEFRESFTWALQQLAARQRNLLRHQVLYGRSIDDIAALYRVHRATAARWLEAIRHTLYTTTRNCMTRRLQVPKDEFSSIMRMISSQLDISLVRALSQAAELEPEVPLLP